MTKEILLATDFSGLSEAAMQVAVEHARQSGARLHLLHVVWPGTDAAPSPALEPLARRLRDSGVTVVTAVASGLPAAEIVRYAAHAAIDLIVVGTHGRTGVTRALIGSVAERVIRTAPCPVLTVPATTRPRPAEAVAPAGDAPRPCLVCGTPSDDLICTTCRARIRSQALEAKLREERPGRV
jgi:nucleotide-binding universal stress UspA family protein